MKWWLYKKHFEGNFEIRKFHEKKISSEKKLREKFSQTFTKYAKNVCDFKKILLELFYQQ